MAFYAELCRRRWYCINCVNMVHVYKQYRYEVWYASLSEKDRENIEKQKQLRGEAADEAVKRLAYMTPCVSALSSRSRLK